MLQLLKSVRLEPVHDKYYSEKPVHLKDAWPHAPTATRESDKVMYTQHSQK